MTTFAVYRHQGDPKEWVFWMFARGKSAAQVKNSVVWRSRGRVARGDVRVVEQAIPQIAD